MYLVPLKVSSQLIFKEFFSADIRAIDLAKTVSGVDNAGNRVDYTGTFTRTDGRARVSAAISFAVNQTLARWTAPDGFTPPHPFLSQTGHIECQRQSRGFQIDTKGEPCSLP